MHAYPYAPRNTLEGYDFEAPGLNAYLRLQDDGWRLTVYRFRGYASVLEEHRTFRSQQRALRWFFAWLQRQ